MHQLTTPQTSAITRTVAMRVLATAGRAPSLHNSQPWRFCLVDGALELRVDPGRAMSISDPTARELVISCGAALYNLRLALRSEALTASVALTPESREPLLLARVTAQAGPPTTLDESRLLKAVNRRHTHRHGFDGMPISAATLSALADDVTAECAELVWVDDPDVLTTLVELAVLADRLQVDDPSWQAEIAQWVDAGTGRRDGIPITSVPLVPPPRRTDRLPDRTFAPGRSPLQRRFRTGAAGRVAVLVTANDLIRDWLSAGQALQRMLLRAADDWVFASFATAPLELPPLREALRDTLQLRGQPQMILELGHSRTAVATPRLPTDVQLDLG